MAPFAYPSKEDTVRSALAWTVAVLVGLPACGVISQAVLGWSQGAGSVVSARLIPLAANTGTIALLSSVTAVGLGLTNAWTLTRYRFKGKSLAIALLVSPLAIPPYVVAQIWLEMTGPGAPLHGLRPLLEQGRLLAASLAIGLCLSPLCFLILRAATSRLDTTFEDAAATMGYGPSQRFWRVVVPMLRPAWAAGIALVGLYACADFGVVESFSTRTFTQAIFFEQGILEQDRALAWGRSAILAALLLLFALPLYVLDRRSRARRSFTQLRGGARFATCENASLRRQCITWLLVGAISLPTSILVVARCVTYLPELEASARIWTQALHSLSASLLWSSAAATLAMTGAFLIAWVSQRSMLTFNRALIPIASMGYVLPGPVIALGLLIVATSIPAFRATIYGSGFIVILAYLVRYLPEAIQSAESGLTQSPKNLEDAARTLGVHPLRALLVVTLPLIRGSMIVSWVLVFTAAMRELPATLLLKPLGSRTLSTEIWTHAQDSWYAEMAPATLLLVACSLPAVVLLLLRDHKR